MKPELEDTLDVLITRYAKHVACYETTGSVWSLCAARGLRKLAVDIALDKGDDAVLNLMWGAPHWLTFNDGTITAMMKKGRHQHGNL